MAYRLKRQTIPLLISMDSATNRLRLADNPEHGEAKAMANARTRSRG